MIFLSMEDELLKVDEQEGTSQTILKGMQPLCLAYDPSNPNRVYCGTYGRGLWRSTDAGENWEPVGAPHAMGPVRDTDIQYAHIMSLAVSPEPSEQGCGRVYAGTEPSAIFYSDDGGDTWRECEAIQNMPSKPLWSFPPRPHTSHVRWLGIDPANTEHVFAAIEFGAFLRSLDGGAHWEDRKFNGPLDTHTFALHPKNPGWIAAAAGDGYFQPGRGFAQSKDAGATWSHPDKGLGHHYLYSLAVDAQHPDILLVGAAHSPREAHSPSHAKATIYRKEGDVPWTEVTVGLPSAEGSLVPTLAAHPSEAGTFFALSNWGLFHSDDAGKTWHKQDIGWKGRFKNQHPHVLVVTPS